MNDFILPSRRVPVAKEKKFSISSVEAKMFLTMYEQSTDKYITEHRKKYGTKTVLKFNSILEETNKKITGSIPIYPRQDGE
jgi:hypothetical protein